MGWVNSFISVVFYFLFVISSSSLLTIFHFLFLSCFIFVAILDIPDLMTLWQMPRCLLINKHLSFSLTRELNILKLFRQEGSWSDSFHLGTNYNNAATLPKYGRACLLIGFSILCLLHVMSLSNVLSKLWDRKDLGGTH